MCGVAASDENESGTIKSNQRFNDLITFMTANQMKCA